MFFSSLDPALEGSSLEEEMFFKSRDLKDIKYAIFPSEYFNKFCLPKICQLDIFGLLFTSEILVLRALYIHLTSKR